MTRYLLTALLAALPTALAQLSDAQNVTKTAKGEWAIRLPAHPAGAPVTVILPGLGGNPWTVNDSRSRYAPLINRLVTAGHAVVVPGATGHTHWGSAAAVSAVVGQMNDVRAAYPALGKEVNLIAESMGNLLARHLLSGGQLKAARWNVRRYVAIDPILSLWAAYSTPVLTESVRSAYPGLPATPLLKPWQDHPASRREPGGLAWLATVPTTIIASREDTTAVWGAQVAPIVNAAKLAKLPLKVVEVPGVHVAPAHFTPDLILPLVR